MAILAWLLSVFLSGAVDAQTCEGSYKASYLEDWRVSRQDWEGVCPSFKYPEEALREIQRKKVASCIKRYGAPAERKGVAAGTVMAYCAQGLRGRQWLDNAVGLPPDEGAPVAPPEPKKEAPPATPGVRLYNWIRSEGSDYHKARGESGPVPFKGSEDWIMKWKGRCDRAVYVVEEPVDIGKPVCYLTAYGAGILGITAILDMGCTGLVKDLQAKGDRRLTQKKADALFSRVLGEFENGCSGR